MNITEKAALWTQFRWQLPFLIVAGWVIINQRKIIWATLKTWWSWGWEGWGFKHWPSERIKYFVIIGIGVVTFLVSTILGRQWREKLTLQQQQQVIEKMKEEKLITQEQIDKEVELERERERERAAQRSGKKLKKPVNFPFYQISPLFAFVSLVIIAPLGEECVFRYLVFEIFGKKNPLAYPVSAVSFIFAHWIGPTIGGGLLNGTTFQLLLLNYLPMTIFFICAYWISDWNLTYPLYFHFLWNLMVFVLAVWW
ncbi:MAG: CPBP family intramembrane metalloprotease [Candidatus Moeniiplasma glomeromycotorum]|nr:CPBP family intramembrane metalloprotease [Candidatus Moeniiplasma glomeromycotorum]MCE8167238.1 CPBP family intramembrane metalloprotease [Candidatus Moeniiplasma glomeromycotorum]MCE8168749.1 CPBP family intramembrane metalloprotease [Candidatus Moeniiplasma glomeromycotorum]